MAIDRRVLMANNAKPTSKRAMEIKIGNVQLKKLNKKQCTRCEIIYDDIHQHFNVHAFNVNKKGQHRYAGQCKKCLTEIRTKRTLNMKNKIETYAYRLIASIKCRASQENIPFELTPQDLIDIWYSQNEQCYYSGEPLDLLAYNKNRKSPHYNFPSVDKKDPKLGYVKTNVVWCKWVINRMKSNLTQEQFIDFCSLITSRFLNNLTTKEE